MQLGRHAAEVTQEMAITFIWDATSSLSWRGGSGTSSGRSSMTYGAVSLKNLAVSAANAVVIQTKRNSTATRTDVKGSRGIGIAFLIFSRRSCDMEILKRC